MSVARALLRSLPAWVWLAGAVTATAADAPEALAVAEIAPGDFVHYGKPLPLEAPGHDDIANIGFIVGRRCVAVIDTGGSVRVGRALRRAIRQRTYKPIC